VQLNTPRRPYPVTRRRSRPSRPIEYASAAAFLIALALIAAALARISTDSLSGQAFAVDGDSLSLGEARLRLEGIDAPELGQKCLVGGRDVDCGREARNHLRALIGGADVACSGWQQDKYGRMLVRCSARSVDLNAAMVRDGWAVAFGDFDAEEREARAERRGLWQGEFQQPRDWRREHVEAPADLDPQVGSVSALFERVWQRILGWF
jgi:endonuclease YncB( thermonuclease family)